MEKVEMIRQVLRGDVMALIPIPPPQPKSHQVSVVDSYKSAALTSQPSHESPATTAVSRKAGLSSTLAATLRGVLHMDLEFKVR